MTSLFWSPPKPIYGDVAPKKFRKDGSTLDIDFKSEWVRIDGETVPLTSQQFLALARLMIGGGGDHFVASRVIPNAGPVIHNLRKKLGPFADCVDTGYNRQGYKWEGRKYEVLVGKSRKCR